MKAVNLLPPDARGTAKKPAAAAASPRPQATGGAGPFVVLGVLAFAVLAIAAYVMTTNTIKDRKAELARVKADHAATIAQANVLKPYADFAVMATARVATVQALATSRFDWEQSLRDVSRALPSNVHLTQLTGNLGGAQGAGASGSTIRGALTSPAVELQGCTRTQSDVARLMSRMRNVRGVTRVSLASSDKDAGTGTAAATGANGEIPAQLCPGKNPPTFNVVVFFEGSNAVPAASTSSATPAASATPAPGATATPAPGTATPPAASTGATTTPVSANQGGSR
jgi:Tfp pilus assembly protein PilN